MANPGNQIITFTNGSKFDPDWINRILYNVLPAGVYSGLSPTIVNNGDAVEWSAGEAIILDNSNKQSPHIGVRDPHEVTADPNAPYFILGWEYDASADKEEDNTAYFGTRSQGNIANNEIKLGKASFDSNDDVTSVSTDSTDRDSVDLTTSSDDGVITDLLFSDNDGDGNQWTVQENNNGDLEINHPELSGTGFTIREDGTVEFDGETGNPGADDRLAPVGYVKQGIRLVSDTKFTAQGHSLSESVSTSTRFLVSVDADPLEAGEVEVYSDGTKIRTIRDGSHKLTITDVSSSLEVKSKDEPINNNLGTQFLSGTSVNLDDLENMSLAVNNALDFGDNGNKMFLYDEGSFTIRSYSLGTAYELGNVFTLSTYDLSGSGLDNPDAFKFAPDGNSFLILDAFDNTIHQFDLSTTWDITTASLGASFDLSNYSQDGSIRNFALGSAGTYLHVLLKEPDIIQNFTLDTAYDFGSTITQGPNEGFDYSRYIGPDLNMGFQLGSEGRFILATEVEYPKNPWEGSEDFTSVAKMFLASADGNEDGNFARDARPMSKKSIIHPTTGSVAEDFSCVAYAEGNFYTLIDDGNGDATVYSYENKSWKGEAFVTVEKV